MHKGDGFEMKKRQTERKKKGCLSHRSMRAVHGADRLEFYGQEASLVMDENHADNVPWSCAVIIPSVDSSVRSSCYYYA